MFESPLLLLGISTVFAAIPAAIWLYIFFKKTEQGKGIVALVFGLGCLTPPALLFIQWLWDPPMEALEQGIIHLPFSEKIIHLPSIFQQILEITSKFNLSKFIENNITGENTGYIAMFILFAALEEIIKMYVIIAIDKRTLLIKTLGDSVKFALASALGFAFAENIWYLVAKIYPQSLLDPTLTVGSIIVVYIFRSVFTTCAHMIFSGIFGYFYGIGKFSIDITEQSKLAEEKHKIAKIIAKIFRLPLSHAYQQQMIIRGLLTAVLMHASYNYLIQINILPPAIIFVILGFLYLRYLLKRKAGHLILATDISTKQRSSLAKKDEDVVVELMGMWFQDKRYVDVIHICERLLERDPDNNVIKLFKAKAMDKIEDKNIYKNILGTVIKTKDDISEKQRNIITKYVEDKEIFRKVKKMVKEQLGKEGKTMIDLGQKTPVQQSQSKQPTTKKDILEDLTDGDSFKINL